MEETPYVHVENTGKIIRRSIYTFFQYYHYFSTIPAILILPFSASLLLLQALFPSSSLQSFSRLNFYLSKMVFASVLSLPFALTSIILAKAFILQTLVHKTILPRLSSSSFVPIYKRLFVTQLYNLVLLIIVYAASFYILSVAFCTLEANGFSSNNPLVLLVSKTVLYSILANTNVICNLALVVTVMEKTKGHMAIREACLLSWSRNSTIISLNLPVNLCILAIEGLFQYRVVRIYRVLGGIGLSMALEGLFIAYLYSLLIVFDTVTSCLFFKSCEANFQTDHPGRYHYQIELVEKEDITIVMQN